MSQYFITGTDTDVGKTLVAAACVLATQGYYWKPINSGALDKKGVQQLTALPDAHFLPGQYQLKASLSPNQAASLENKTIELQHCQLPSVNKEYALFVEGAGGVYTPLNDQDCMMDLMRHLALPVIIVCRGTLGTINHTLLTLEALRNRCIPIKGIAFSGELSLLNQRDIERVGQVPVLFHVPFFAELTNTIFQQWVKTHQAELIKILLNT